ncbi:unnamed protein product [Arabidopsis halleri]
MANLAMTSMEGSLISLMGNQPPNNISSIPFVSISIYIYTR